MLDGTVRKVVWALDPNMADEDLRNRVIETLRALLRRALITIEPVSVVHPDSENERRAAIEFFLNSTNLCGLLPPRLLAQEHPSARHAAKALLDYARTSGGDLIAVGTHARSGPRRFISGSFAETLILQSEIPTLTVNPQTSPVGEIDQILFPTDFSPEASDSFERVLHLAGELEARIHLYHRTETFADYLLPMLEGSPGFELATEEQARRLRRHSERWCALARQRGIAIGFEQDEFSPSTAQAILDRGERMKSGIIAMTSHSGALASSILGSVSRQVLRHAACPVWVLHPGMEKRAA